MSEESLSSTDNEGEVAEEPDDVDGNNNDGQINNENDQQRVHAGRRHISTQRLSLTSFNREIQDNQSFHVSGKNGMLLKFGILRNHVMADMPRIYMCTMVNPRTSVHFHVTWFIALCKTVRKFHRSRIIGDNYTLGRNSYISFMNTGRRYKTLQICIYVANIDTSLDFFMDNRMQRQFLVQYKPMLRYCTYILRRMTEDDVVVVTE